jgi:hypothetical protein
MTTIGIELTGERAAILRFEQFPKFAHDRLFAALQNIEQRLEAAVLAAEPEKTGQLKSITGGRVYDHDNRIAAVVGVRTQDGNIARKAGALEYGSRHESLMVRAHTAKLSHLWGRAISPISVEVGAHSRTPNIDAFRFLRGPLDAIRSTAIAELQAALDAATKDGSA